MAGSLAAFIYTEDSPNGTSPGRSKLLKLDESNTRSLGEIPATTATVAAAGASNKIERASGNERYITASGLTSAGKLFSRRITVPSAASPLFLTGGTIILPVLVGGGNQEIENVLCQVTQAVGEARRFVSLVDTGLDDGTP